MQFFMARYDTYPITSYAIYASHLEIIGMYGITIFSYSTATVRAIIQSPTEPWQTAGMRDEISHRRVVTFERRINRNRRIPDPLGALR